MAELGNIFGGSASTGEQKIEIEMLDFGYIRDCKDWNQLSAIVDVLKSGKEGHYPDLIRVAEEKLVELLPPKEKRRYFSMNHKTTPAEIAEAESELNSWQRTVLAKDESIQHSRAATVKKIVPVRGSSDGAKNTVGDMEAKEGDLAAVQDEGSQVLLAILNANQRKKFEKMQSELRVADLTLVKRQYKAGLEKTKGNESFRIADNQDAVACYSKSLAYDPTSAVVWANRAMAYIRLELFDLAEADSSVALLLDPTYVKAYSRRGLVRFKRGKYAEAVQDFSHALQLDPGSAELTKLLHTAREKYHEVEGISAAVEEEAEHDGTEVVEVPGPVGSSDNTEVQVLHVAESALLVFPPASALTVKSGSYTRTVKPVSPFVRINVVSDDESDEEEYVDDAQGSGAAMGQGVADAAGSTRSAFNRVAITEDDSDSDADDQKAVIRSAEQLEQRAAELKEEGNALLKEGDAAGAIVRYTQSLSILPMYLPSLNNRAQAHLTLKAFSLSELDSSAVLNQEPHNVKALYRRALALSAQLRTSEALADVAVVLSLDPQNSLARELHARLSAALPTPLPPPTPTTVNPPSSRGSAAPPAHPHATIDVQSLRQKAQQLLGDGLNDKVISLLGQYLRAVDQPPFSELLQSDQTSLLHLLATAYSSTEDYGHAVAVQATILQIDPTNSRALYKRAEGQLQLATQTKGEEARRAALQLAEEDIEAASKAQSGGGAEVLGLRQKLLRLRNTVPESSSLHSSSATPSSASDKAATRSTSSRVQSDAQKDLGNKAMTDKNFSTAVMHYSNAIKFDDTNLAAFNNRALAHLKLGAFPEAEADATVVIGSGEDRQEVSGGCPSDVQALRLKALCRRAQARRAIGEALLAKLADQARARSVQAPSPPAASEIQRVFTEALQDLQTLLRQDPTNKTALAEQKLTKDALKKAADLTAPPKTVSVKTVEDGNGAPPAPRVAPAADSAKKAPRADMNRVSAMLGSPSSASSRASAGSPAGSPAASLSSSPAAFGDLGMVARSSKKLNTSASDGDGGGALGTDSAVRSAGVDPVTPLKAAMPAAQTKKAVSSPTPSIVLTAAPTEAPKTVYEFERVWRGLKGRPDLFAQYLGCFKKGTYKKVLKEAVSPDLISFMWKALRDHAPSPQVQLKALNGFSSVPSFALTLSLLPENDVRCVQSIMSTISAHVQSLPTQSEEELLSRSVLEDNLTSLRSVYGMN